MPLQNLQNYADVLSLFCVLDERRSYVANSGSGEINYFNYECGICMKIVIRANKYFQS
jgi:hypothetical protein